MTACKAVRQKVRLLHCRVRHLGMGAQVRVEGRRTASLCTHDHEIRCPDRTCPRDALSLKLLHFYLEACQRHMLAVG